MKPARSVMERPLDLAAVLSTIAGAEGTTKIMAGGQSLGPMLNLRLVEPERIVDISGVPELRRIDRAKGRERHIALGLGLARRPGVIPHLLAVCVSLGVVPAQQPETENAHQTHGHQVANPGLQ